MEVSDQYHATAAMSPRKDRGARVVGGYLGLRTSLGVSEKRRISCFAGIRKPNRPDGSCYTDWSVAAPCRVIVNNELEIVVDWSGRGLF